MKPGAAVFLILLAVLATGAQAARPKALAQGEAGVVGGWSGTGPVDGIVLKPVVGEAGCLKLGGESWMVSDHQDLDHPAVSTVIRLKPGRYAIAGASWSEPWLDQYDMVGLSRPDGDMWTFDLQPGVVTYIGVWPIRSPYAHRYAPAEPDLTRWVAAARTAADGEGPVATAKLSRAKVLDQDEACPAAAAGATPAG